MAKNPTRSTAPAVQRRCITQRRGDEHRRPPACAAPGDEQCLQDADDSYLAELVAAGNRHAAEVYVARRLDCWRSMARRIAGSAMDPDDLLSEAVIGLLGRLALGKSPVANIDGYVISSMRHRLIDELRSPRARVLHLAEWAEIAVEDDDRGRLVEDEESLLVRAAMDRLPTDQQRVLIATIVDGRKPRHLEADFGRPASAIYSLTRRAKVAFRRNLLQILMERSGRPDCRMYAARLPEVLPQRLPDPCCNDSLRHLAACEHCSREWAQLRKISAGCHKGAAKSGTR